MFATGGGIEAFPESKVIGIYLSEGVETRQKMPTHGRLTFQP